MFNLRKTHPRKQFGLISFSGFCAEANAEFSVIKKRLDEKPVPHVSSLTLLFWENGYDVIAKLWKPVFLIAAIVLLFSVTATAYVSLRLKISPRLLVKKIFPAAFIGLTTSSSVAAFSSVLETCEKKLGIDIKFAKIAVPIGHLLFAAPFGAIFLISSFFLASYFHMEISILWLVQLVFMSA